MNGFVTLDQIDDELTNGPLRRRFVVDGCLPAGPILAYAPPGVGKTGLAVETALSIAGGRPWAGHEVQQGGVLYLAGENYFGVKERLLAATRFKKMDTGSLPIALLRPGSAGLVSLKTKEEVAEAARYLQTTSGAALSLIVVDTLGASFGAKSQDDAEHASAFMNHVEMLCEEFSCAALVLHHCNKDGRIRGSQVFEDRSDAVMKLDRQRAGEVLITITKQRSAPDGQQFLFRIDGFDLRVYRGSISVQVVDDLRQKAAGSASPDDARESDRTCVMRLLAKLAVNDQVDYWDLRQTCFSEWSTRDDQARRTALSSTLKKLQSDGSITVDKENHIVTIVSKATANRPANTAANRDDDGVSERVSATPPIRGGANTRTANTSSQPTDVPAPNKFTDRNRSRPRTGTEG